MTPRFDIGLKGIDTDSHGRARPDLIARLVVVLFAIALVTWLASPARAVDPPDDFVVENALASSNFGRPVTIAFLPDGRWLVGEKQGRIFIVENGVQRTAPVLDIRREVESKSDAGLLSLVVDPAFATNRLIYVLYTVDPDSNNTDDDEHCYGRISRFRMTDAEPTVADYSTRAVLMGHDWRHGPTVGQYHTINELAWGADGSLLVSVGDGAASADIDPGGLHPDMFGPTRTDPVEDIGAFRAQFIGSLCGKILRIDRTTGHGLESNPFWNGDPTSNPSKVYAVGFRNPFRFSILPGTGSPDPAAGNPGVLFVGDVGRHLYEEINVVSAPGQNFGWPCYEGVPLQPYYPSASPSHHGCNRIGTPDIPGIPIPPVHAAHHETASLATPPGFVGKCAIGGVFYSATRYPARYRGGYFFGDYDGSVIRFATFGPNHELLTIENFATAADGPVDFDIDPVTGDVLYCAINTNQVRRIRYTGPVTNQPPQAAASATPRVVLPGQPVQFSSAGTIDAEGDPISFGWSFGDLEGGTEANPVHAYALPGSYAAILTASDGPGSATRDTARVVVAASLAFPRSSVLDDFQVADGPPGVSWAVQAASFAVSGGALTQAVPGSAAMAWSPGFGPNQECFVTLASLAIGAPPVTLVLKAQGTGATAARLEARYDDAAGTVTVYACAAGGACAPAGAPLAASLGDGDQFGVRALVTGDVEVFANGASLGAVSVATWPFAAAGGRIGLGLAGATATRLDDVGGGDMVLDPNVPPRASIVSPADGSFFHVGQSLLLEGRGSDTEDPASELRFRWEVDLHHNTHIHHEVLVDSVASRLFEPEQHDDGTGVHHEARFIVTDRGARSDTALTRFYPEVDLEPGAVRGDSASIAPGSALGLEFWLRNHGRMPAPFSRWQIRSGVQMLAQGDTLVPPRDSVRVSRRLAPALPPGTHPLAAVADALAAVRETDEANNTGAGSLEVRTPPVDPSPPVAFDRRIAAGADDAEESSSGSVSLNSSDLELMTDGGVQRAVGLRFTNLPIPPGSQITAAHLVLKVDESFTTATSLVIRAQAIDSAPAFTTASSSLSTRAATGAQVSWPAIPVWTVGTTPQSPGIATVIREVVGRPGWRSGNALALLITGTGRRTVEAFEGDAAGAPLLHVEYKVPLHAAPVVSAGIDQAITLPADVALDGSATDDGIPGPLVTQWVRAGGSGTGTVTFQNASAIDTRASFSAAGVYVLALTASDGAITRADSATITVAPAPGPPPGSGGSLDRRIAAGADDAEESSSGSVTLNSSDLELMTDGGVQRAVGLRFTNLGVPRGAVVTAAHLVFKVDESFTTATSLVIRAQAVDSAPAFTTANGSLSSRAVTGAQVSWPAIPAWAVGSLQQSPGIATVIREVVGRPGWQSGNALAVLISGTGRRTVEAFEGDAAGAPLLHVEWTTPPAAEGASSTAAAPPPEWLDAWVVPHPVRIAGVLHFTTPQAGPLRIELFDVEGRRVATLLDAIDHPAGRHRVDLDRRTLQLPGGAGLYWYRVTARSGRVSGKLVMF